MSRINDRSRQLAMAFRDQDLLHPEHDTIMEWLVKWAKKPDNVLELFAPAHPWRRLNVTHALTSDAFAGMEALSKPQRIVESYFASDQRPSMVDVSSAWPDEPNRRLKVDELLWEQPVKDARGGLLGFVDLLCSVRVSWALLRCVERRYKVVPGDPAQSRHRGFDFEAVGEEFLRWEQTEIEQKVAFEVKTAIPSIGELMRQINLYRSSETCGSALFAVVAPPNERAAAVCRSQGVAFVPYQPSPSEAL